MPLNRVVHLAAMHRHVARSFNAESHFVAANLNNSDDNVVADDDSFILAAGKHKHGVTRRKLGNATPCDYSRRDALTVGVVNLGD